MVGGTSWTLFYCRSQSTAKYLCFIWYGCLGTRCWQEHLWTCSEGWDDRCWWLPLCETVKAVDMFLEKHELNISSSHAIRLSFNKEVVVAFVLLPQFSFDGSKTRMAVSCFTNAQTLLHVLGNIQGWINMLKSIWNIAARGVSALA